MIPSDAPGAPGSRPVLLSDYRAPAWRIEHVELACDLDIDASEIRARLALRRNGAGAAPLRLDGEGLALRSINLDGRALEPGEYMLDAEGLTVPGARDGSVLETVVRVEPAKNTALEGLYLSGPRETGFLLTQCEAQGFRRITYCLDRPDVLARYTVTLRADRARFPVLLANGNPDGAGALPDGRHWARFVDPHPKPSYLFALVAGRLEHIERDYVTAEGRAVKLRIFAEADAIGRCGYALDALERAMRWDERVYGRNYDLDVFHIVATHDFNMGAMENKGLNIFNAKYLLADPDATTDDEYRQIEAVVAHEYFHNWTGNRVTCRDWFQLSLKEGLTVFREQSFSADMGSPALKRIEDVSTLRRAQFPEDAGPLAHAVRPAQYCEINNFYTATVYEKGAELVRMLAGRLGADGFRRGTDLYFARHDGQAVTVEDFLKALGDANGLDLMPYLDWYRQAGTPRVRAREVYDAATRSYALTLGQHTPPTPGQAQKRPLPIPLRVALFARDGRLLPLRLEGEAAAAGEERVLELTAAEQTFRFVDVPEPPLPSLLRGFSAPVIVESDEAPADLAFRLRHESDGYNRWDAGQRLAQLAFDAALRGGPGTALVAWCEALAALFDDAALDAALLAELLTPPSAVELGERCAELDPDAVHEARETLENSLAARLGAALEPRYRALHAQADGTLDAAAQARRRLKRRVLDLLCRHDPARGHASARLQFDGAHGMTDRLAALAALVRSGAREAGDALARYRRRYDGNALALDKWFALQAQVPAATALQRVQALMRDPAFTLRNPNRVYALLRSYAQGNPVGFHRADGAAYFWLVERLRELDAINPSVAARLATAFNGWRRLEPVRRRQAQQALAALAADAPRLSRDLADILERTLAG
ncbi:aminopeptidase N [Mizugakiibacter sediminis]|uniref:Aminopeptidase N n=1 Tax=Mizugakiibacter sediminis TaxID=1475481 RepID=A0A0K8QMG6_9GAMM|nr:aminopeptidase N [Mizugakiibacter sediminis]GAP66053.1 aminopeptidase N [Mizugakiibacter sediminis]